MIDSFRGLVTEHANVIVLQPPSFPTSGGPAPVMDDEPNEEFALCRSSRPAEQLGSRNWVLSNEERRVSRGGGEDPIRSPPPANPIRLIRSEIDLPHAIPSLQIFQ